MIPGGFAGKILTVDLSREEIKTEVLPGEQAEDYIGGLGLCLKLAHDTLPQGVAPLDKENVIVFGAGPLVGTNLPATSRVFAVTKMPTSHTIGWAGSGGVNFGCQLKNAGFDHIIIKGKSERPVYLSIEDNTVEIRDAGSLWGKNIGDTCSTIWEENDHPTGIICIGQAGENLVNFSMAFIEGTATLGRGGLGAVMGSKNLKAVVAKGSQGIPVADKKRYNSISRTFLQKIKDYPYLKEWQEQGMIKSFPEITMDLYDKIKIRRKACVSCPVGCKDVVQIKDGPYEGLVSRTSSVINLFTPVFYGFKDYRESMKLVVDLDQYGMDAFEFFGLMTFAKSLSDAGIIPKNRLVTEVSMGSLESMEQWAEAIALRQGLGDVFANGFDAVIEEFGERAKSLSPALVKGMHPYAGPGSALPWDLFGSMELGQILDPRGPHVGSGGSPTYFAKRPMEVFPKHFKRMGIPEEAFARILSGVGTENGQPDLKVGRLLKYSHSWFSTLGSLGICARAQINRFYNAELCADLYESVTGIKTSLPDLRRRVERVWTLYRMLNLREGFSREENESVPTRWFKENGFKDYVSEQPLTKDQIEGMIGDYYEEWGWDRTSGIPTYEVLQKLGLDSPLNNL